MSFKLNAITGNLDLVTPSNPGTVTSIATSNGITGGTITSSGTISGVNALSDGTTKGVSTYTAADFNDNGSGLISLDYANGQKASGSQAGFLSSSDWTTFNGKSSISGLTTNTVTKATSSTGIGNSNITDDGTTIKLTSASNITGTNNLYFGNDTNAYLVASATTSADIKIINNTISGDTSTGGAVTFSGGNTIRTFNSSGTFVPSFTGNIKVLVVAGGGSGGGSNTGGGGGGGGGIVENLSFAVTQGNSYTVTIGSGGTSVSSSTPSGNGNNGNNSVFGSITANGGGGGAGVTNSNGVNGGCGGGGTGNTGTGGTGSQGGNGGNALSAGGWVVGGGGGGAGPNNGTNGSGSGSAIISGHGGNGYQSSVSSVNTYYAGGGAGGLNGGGNGNASSGGQGGGASFPTTADSPGNNGTVNTGGGGSGANAFNANQNSGAGGSGIVIVNYVTPTGATENSRFTTSGNFLVGLTSTSLSGAGNIESSNVIKADVALNSPAISNLTTNGYIKTSGGNGTLGIQAVPIPIADGGTGATTLVGANIPTVVGSTFEKSETGSDANVLTYTSGGSDEFLIVYVATDVSAITGTSIVVTITWKDSNNSTATSTLTLTAVGDGTINLPINSKASNTVIVSTTFVGVSTAYKISAFINRLK